MPISDDIKNQVKNFIGKDCLYVIHLLKNKDTDIYKFGITSDIITRLNTHLRELNFTYVVKVFECNNEIIARKAESRLKKYALSMNILTPMFNKTEIITCNDINLVLDFITENTDLLHKDPTYNVIINKPIIKNQTEDKFKCYNCGKLFRDDFNLQKHKKAKKSCLIIDITDDIKNAAHRCIFCNRTFSTKYTLNTHHKTCKIKNGGMNILYDKVKHEQEKAAKLEDEVLKTKDKLIEAKDIALKAKDNENNELRERIKLLESKILNQPQTTTNIINNNITNNINITINSYDKPNVDYIRGSILELLNAYKINTPTFIANEIWFSKNHKENYSLYLVNKKTGDALVHKDGAWIHKNTNELIPTMRHISYNTVICSLDNIKDLNETQQWLLDRFRINEYKSEQIAADEEKIKNYLYDNMDMKDKIKALMQS